MFRVGDEVVCVDTQPYHTRNRPNPCLVEGRVYQVSGIGLTWDGLPGILLRDCPVPYVRWPSGREENGFYRARRFRKVQKRNSTLSIESFLTIKPGFEEPRRVNAPARKRESV